MSDSKLTISEVNQIYNKLKSISGFDFENYAFSFKMRKIISLMKAENVFTVGDFIYRLQNSENTVSEFVKSLFVPQSELFRDAELWNYLHEKNFPKLLLKESVKIHIPYCTAGEELYSLMYFLGLYKSTHVSVLVSHPLPENEGIIKNRIFLQKDLKACLKNIEMLDYIRNTEDVFTERTNYFKFNHFYRGNVDFKCEIPENQQYISEFDMVLFRNRLIYYNENLQEDILRKVNVSLNKGGFLIVGEKEISGKFSGKFKKMKSNLSVYKKKMF